MTPGTILVLLILCSPLSLFSLRLFDQDFRFELPLARETSPPTRRVNRKSQIASRTGPFDTVVRLVLLGAFLIVGRNLEVVPSYLTAVSERRRAMTRRISS